MKLWKRAEDFACIVSSGINRFFIPCAIDFMFIDVFGTILFF
jgi:hypothetical protein